MLRIRRSDYAYAAWKLYEEKTYICMCGILITLGIKRTFSLEVRKLVYLSVNIYMYLYLYPYQSISLNNSLTISLYSSLNSSLYISFFLKYIAVYI